MPNQLQYQDKILRINDFSLLGMVQSNDWSPSFNATDVFELGSISKLDTAIELETQGSFEMTAIGGLASVLTRMMVARNASGDFLGYVYNSAGAPNSNTLGVTGAGGKNGYTFAEDALKECTFDLVMHEKADQSTYNRSVIFPRCFLTQVSGRFDANGYASETINWQGDFVIGAPTPFHDVRVLHGIQASGTTFNAKDVLTGGGNWNGTGYTIMYVYVNEVRFRANGTGDAENFTFTTPASGLFTLTSASGRTLAKGDLIKAIMYRTTPVTTFPTLASTDRYTSAFWVKGFTASIFIAPTTGTAPTASEQWLKAQSLDYTIDLKVEALRQIAFSALGSSVYARVPTFPIDVSASASTFETDWSDWKRILNKSFTGDVSNQTLDLAPSSLKTTFNLTVNIFTKTGSQLQQWVFDDMRLDGYGNRINVGGRSEISWAFKGTSFQLLGT